MAVGFHPNPAPVATLGRSHIGKSTSNASWPPAAAERTRRDEDEDVADHPAVAAARRAVEPYDTEGESELSKADESLLDMERPSVREAVSKADAPTKAAVKKAADTLGLAHLAKFDSYGSEVG